MTEPKKPRKKPVKINKEQMIDDIAAGKDSDMIAVEHGCSEATVRKYRAMPDVIEAVRAARLHRVRRQADRIAILFVEGLDVMGDIMRDPEASRTEKIGAFRALAQSHGSQIQAADLADRIAVLETQIRRSNASHLRSVAGGKK